MALILFLAAAGLWFLKGAHRGFTKTTVEVKTVDEVTGIEGIEYKKQFVPGLDFLGAAALGAGVLAGVSFVIRKKSI
jgi:hypothetical protein